MTASSHSLENPILQHYYEILPKVKILHLTVSFTSKNDCDKAIINLQPNIVSYQKGDANSSPINVHLISEITPDTANITKLDNLLKIKCRLRTGSIEFSNLYSNQNLDESLLNATEIQNLQHIQCHQCKNLIFSRNFRNRLCQSALRVINLPSEHWHELVDSWMCHKEDISALKGNMGNQILSRQNVVMVGDTYFLLNINDIIENSIKLQPCNVSPL